MHGHAIPLVTAPVPSSARVTGRRLVPIANCRPASLRTHRLRLGTSAQDMGRTRGVRKLYCPNHVARIAAGITTIALSNMFRCQAQTVASQSKRIRGQAGAVPSEPC